MKGDTSPFSRLIFMFPFLRFGIIQVSNKR